MPQNPPKKGNLEALSIMLGPGKGAANNPSFQLANDRRTNQRLARERHARATRAGAPSHELEGLRLLMGIADDDVENDPLTKQGIEVDAYNKAQRDAMMRGFKPGGQQGVRYASPTQLEGEYGREAEKYKVDAPVRAAQLGADADRYRADRDFAIKEMEVTRKNDRIKSLASRTNAANLEATLKEAGPIDSVDLLAELGDSGIQMQNENARNVAQQVASLAYKLENMKGLEGAVGLPEWSEPGSWARFSPLGGAKDAQGNRAGGWFSNPPLEGSDAADFQTHMDQLKAIQGIPQLSHLRGLGHMSNREFEVITNAATSLKNAQSNEMARAEIRRIRNAALAALRRFKNNEFVDPNDPTDPATLSFGDVVPELNRYIDEIPANKRRGTTTVRGSMRDF